MASCSSTGFAPTGRMSGGWSSSQPLWVLEGIDGEPFDGTFSVDWTEAGSRTITSN